MFWTFLLITSLATALVQLGAASATASFLSAGLQASLIIIAILAILLLWKNYSTKEDQNQMAA